MPKKSGKSRGKVALLIGAGLHARTVTFTFRVGQSPGRYETNFRTHKLSEGTVYLEKVDRDYTKESKALDVPDIKMFPAYNLGKPLVEFKYFPLPSTITGEITVVGADKYEEAEKYLKQTILDLIDYEIKGLKNLKEEVNKFKL